MLVAEGLVRSSFELFDPATGVWAMPPETLNVDRSHHTATMLSDGRVMVVSGNTFEIFDPTTGVWTMPRNPQREPIESHGNAASDGRALVISGDSSETYDPVTGTWTLTSGLHSSHLNHTATLLRDGRVLVAGGNRILEPAHNFEIFDPATSTWIQTSATLNPAADTGTQRHCFLTVRCSSWGGVATRGQILTRSSTPGPESGVWGRPGGDTIPRPHCSLTGECSWPEGKPFGFTMLRSSETFSLIEYPSERRPS